MITIREAKPGDADELATLNRAFNGVDRDRDRIRQFLLEPSSEETVLVGEDAGNIIGFLCLQTLRSMCYDSAWVEITELYVVPGHRGRGIGEALVRDAEVRAKNAGASEMLLRTNSENGRAQALCRRAGLEAASHVVFRRSYSGVA